MRKRMLSTLLALCMVLGMLPGTAFARQGTYLLDSGLSIPYTKLGRQEAMIGMIDANSVANIVFPDSIDGYVITSFTASTFGLCSELKSVTIPFYTSSLQWSFLPHGVAGLGACSKLENIFVSAGNSNFQSVDGVLYSKDGLSVVCYPAGRNSPSYSVKQGTTTIDYVSFANCSNIAQISIPGSVKTIRDAAFYGCTKLTDVYYDGTEAEWNAISISDDNNSALTSATIHYNSTGSQTKSGTCGENLTWIFDESGTLTISGTGAMYDYEYESEYGEGYNPAPWYVYRNIIKSIIIQSGVANLGNSAFYECTNLTSVKIPSSITTIGHYAFSDCPNLSNVTIPTSATSIKSWAFANCGLYTLVIPNRVTEIGYGAFSGCRNLTNVTIPGSVTSIGWYAFEDCSKLSGVTIPIGITQIGEGTFHLCSALNDVYYSGSEEQWHGITIDAYNDPLTTATIHYNSTGPDDQGGAPSTGDIKFNPDIYRADKLLDMSEPMGPTIRDILSIQTPCSLYVPALQENGFETWSTSWTVLTTLFDTVDSPSHIYDFAIKEKDMYSAIILAMLEASTDIGVVDSCEAKIKDAKGFVSEINMILKTEYDIDGSYNSTDWKNLTTREQQLVKEVSEKVYKKNYQADISSINKVFSNVGNALEIADCIETYLETISTAITLTEMSESMKTVLREMYELCPPSNLALKAAISDCIAIIILTSKKICQMITLQFSAEYQWLQRYFCTLDIAHQTAAPFAR